MLIKKIIGNEKFIEELENKSASFLLGNSVTETCNIEGITQAGIPGMIHLTPTLDSEFVCTGRVYSMEDIAETPKGVPTPALITRAIHQLIPFHSLEVLDLGLKVIPKIENHKLYSFNIKPSSSIDIGAGIDSKKIYEKGLEFGSNYETDSDYIIMAESTPAGTTTAKAVTKALGYKTEGLFSSSFKNVPTDIKDKTINQALDLIKDEEDIFKKLDSVSDNMLLFVAGFITTASKNKKVVLAGGTQMASALLVANSLGSDFNEENIGLFTTKWVVEDRNSDIKKILEQLDFTPNCFYSDFSFFKTNVPPLKLYDQGEAKEGVGAGGAICYGFLNGLDSQGIIEEIEKSF
ncbi:MAG: TIGR00303 family protein [Campylobacterales bacterium]|nr:TIGR00303 family protein [Campylobacterales bacterium]